MHANELGYPELQRGRGRYAGFYATLRGRFGPAWSLGLVGSYDTTAEQNGVDSSGRDARVGYRFWRVAGEGRWHIRGKSTVDPFVSVEAGIASSSSTPSGAGGSESLPGVKAFSFGAALGLDVAIIRYLSVGGALGVLVLPFPEATMNDQRLSGSDLYGLVFAPWAGVMLTARVPAADP